MWTTHVRILGPTLRVVTNVLPKEEPQSAPVVGYVNSHGRGKEDILQISPVRVDTGQGEEKETPPSL